jgi:hypothetical protein
MLASLGQTEDHCFPDRMDHYQGRRDRRENQGHRHLREGAEPLAEVEL